MMMTEKQFNERKRRRKKLRKLIRITLRLTALVAVIAVVVTLAVLLVKTAVRAMTKSDGPKGKVVAEKDFATPTPTPTVVPVEGLIRRDPKNDHYLVLKIKSDYENNKEVNVRSNPDQKSALLGKLKVGDEIHVSCSFSDPERKGYTGFLGSELGFGRHIVWVYNLYVDVNDVVEPWAVTLPYDYGYSQKYGKSRVTIRSRDGNSDANVRSIPWEEENSSYGRILVNTTFVADKVYVSGDQQWFGFPAASLTEELEKVLMDPDGIVWIYQAYCTIDKIK